MRTAPSVTAALAATLAATLILTGSGFAQTDPNLAMNNPDLQAWTLFLTVNADAKTAGNNNALFETWARDGETFVPNPVWPTTPTPVATGERALGLVLQRARPGGLLPFAVPGGNATEETRRNKPDFDFIVANNLYKVSGLKAAFAANKPLSFPVDSIEVKANWVEVSGLKDFNGFTGTPEDAAKIYHVNSAGGKQYALVSMHVISKLVPNWTWATFEHKDNPGRCDVIGCKDSFGAQQAVTPPLSPVESKQHYGDCAKTPALTALLARANVDPAYVNYCLKGSQSDFTDATGLAVRVGNSVTENSFVAQASCMTCHGRAAFDKAGKATSFAGFDPITISLPAVPQNTGNAQVGPINPNWYWVAGGPPSYPVLAGEGDIQQIALAADFVWSIPFCAIDDTANPPETKSKFCGNK
jgi:hypothetical protein